MPSKVSKRKVSVNKDASESSSKKTVKSSESEEFSHWLIKSEPESRMENGVDMKFGIEDLIACPDSTSCWDGVRNYSARNYMRAMKVDDDDDDKLLEYNDHIDRKVLCRLVSKHSSITPTPHLLE